ncbi:alpha/beta hydrolase [Microbacterium sp.]|uniref:alpha/beta fold hydrolase n=1 Tax=Microbacterium sp. TaxID=51671 RepID=UPI002616D1CF|nr:alpha/beta hydrolase [Microbacterium sp.]
MKAYVVAGALAGVIGVAVWFLREGPKLPRDIDDVIDRVAASDLTHVVAGETGYAASDGVRIWYEAIGADGSEKGVVLLHVSMAGDSLFWPPEFIRALVRAGYRVIRFDPRGTGASDWMPDWSRKHPYSLLDMAADAVAVLDAQHVKKAHIIGLSLGGFVAQEIAIGYPDRIASLTLMSSAADPTDPRMPPMRLGPMLRAGVRGLPLLRYRFRGGERNLVKERVAKIIGATGPEGVDVEDVAELVLYDLRYRRGTNLRAIIQHQVAVAVTRSRYPLLGGIRAPTLVIHGTVDSFLPIAHAEKLVTLIPASQHLWLDGVDHHQFPYPDMPAVTEAIISHLDKAG